MPDSTVRYDGHLCAGHLLVWTWRKLLAGQEDCPLLAAEYRRIAGDDARGLLCLFANFLQALGQGSRRVLSLGQPRCIGLTNDEVQMLRLAAAAQAVDHALLSAHLAWLVRREGQPAAQAAVLLLMARLRAAGVVLPEVAPLAPPPRPRLEMVWSGQEKAGGEAAGFSASQVATQ